MLHRQLLQQVGKESSVVCQAAKRHRSIAKDFLDVAVPAFATAGVALRGDPESVALGVPEAADEEDWTTEYLDLILAVKVQVQRSCSRYSSVAAVAPC